MIKSFPLCSFIRYATSSQLVCDVCAVLLVLSVALASTGALSQTAATIMAEVIRSPVSLPSDEKLARAYALCIREEVGRLDKGCPKIESRWLSYAPNTAVDRSFIKNVAKDLSKTNYLVLEPAPR
jgi:hypothetical protein